MSVPDVTKLGCGVNGKLGPVVTADHVRVSTVVQQEVHAGLVSLLRGDEQRCTQINCLRVHVGT